MSLNDVKQHVNVTVDKHDAELLRITEAASLVVKAQVTDASWLAQPMDLQYAVLVVARRLWETQLGNSPASGGALPDTDQDGLPIASLGLPLLPPLARTLLEPYRRSDGGQTPTFSFPTASEYRW